MAAAGLSGGRWALPLVRWAVVALLLGLCRPYSGTAGAGLRALERDVKAAYLYNFLFFVRWPGQGEMGELSICVLGPDPFGPSFLALDGRRLPNGKTLRIREIPPPDGSAMTRCNILFLPKGLDREEVDRALKRVRGRPVLTVSDRPGFLREGGVLSLVTVKGRVRWRIHLSRARRSGLELSSQLLRNAIQVEE